MSPVRATTFGSVEIFGLFQEVKTSCWLPKPVQDRLRRLGGVARWPLQVRVPVQLRRGQEAHLRLGDEEHQQPQRQHPQEVLPWSSGESFLTEEKLIEHDGKFSKRVLLHTT